MAAPAARAPGDADRRQLVPTPLRELRIAAGLSQRAGLAAGTVLDVELGRQLPYSATRR